MSKMQKFYVDAQQKGVVRGGWFDDMGGILVGSSAQEVCDALNVSLSTDTITISREDAKIACGWLLDDGKCSDSEKLESAGRRIKAALNN